MMTKEQQTSLQKRNLLFVSKICKKNAIVTNEFQVARLLIVY
jgi:hypothetical protein